jgi:hypothetical protein
MDTINVVKADLIETLRKNREEHQAIFEKAQEVYRDQMIAELNRALNEAKTGGKIIRSFRLPVPENHTEDFDTAIQMLEWHTETHVELTIREFTQYVENKWGWQQSFAGNTEAYVAH